ncbi:related to Zinc-regulated transporter 2 [Saccharomycodes ludwigii]|uniref:Related to Zinc-regulated transporter 2 n=1 Tax=Saccharomycodes ludwigii TaxID=36035 RepID=A0A376B1B7_9ASCO|nr:hypothetical protein SCDLUD_001768 [Saccharomycodes ludwigii]KAH3901980.1 hypothetical protein SCDLUD_001768 [Saccharomycodes ludwigii]SSD58478.1 related to Zinc-regulated transporter 2 [Saccharomycodes ludwigii]
MNYELLDTVFTNATAAILEKRDDDDGCVPDNDYDGRDNLRVLALFIILISSAIGSFFPILSSRYSFIRLPDWCFFIAKFFGSGVIVATGFIHLLQPAYDALNTECLGGTFVQYPWAFGICLMSLFTLFLTEIIAHHYIEKSFGNASGHSHFGNLGTKDDSHMAHIHQEDIEEEPEVPEDSGLDNKDVHYQVQNVEKSTSFNDNDSKTSYPDDIENAKGGNGTTTTTEEEDFAAKFFAIFVLEFGILFHSVFIGLSLAVAGDEFITLFIVLVFHQMFEGLGLGTRIAEAEWPHSRRFTPWLLALGFTLTTPIAIGIGIGVRHSFAPNSRKALISNGCFDAISSGILIYTGLVELMAHEFLYSDQFKGKNGLRKMLLAFFIMCWGTGLMALLGKWA